jgi:hypothetical protein
MPRRIKSIILKNRFFLLLIILLAFVRFYRLEEFITFLGDQGRDAIIIKRIAVLEKLPAIGPVSSVGGMFLGPFYYYLMAPFLLLFQFNPVGLGFAVGLLSLFGLIYLFFITKKELNKNAAYLFLILAGFAKIIVEYNRFSWNPNLLPFFAFVTLYFLVKFYQSENTGYLFLFGAFLALSLQLHYLAFLLGLTIAVFILFNYKKTISFFKWKNLIILTASFLIFYSPLIIFDLRHQFINSKNLIKVFTQEKIVSSSESFSNRFLSTNHSFFQYVFNIKINQTLAFLLFLLIFIYFVKNRGFRKNLFLQINFLNFFSYIIGFSILRSFRHPHYYMVVYLSFYLILAYLMANFAQKNLFKKFFIFVTVIIFLYINGKNYPFFKKEGNFQTRIAKKIADSILERNPQLPYQIVPIPFTEMDGHIRYYLEIDGKRPLAEESPQVGNELYVLCYEKSCDVLNHPQWQIAAFYNKKIKSIWTVDRVKIYQLIHEK